MPRLVCGYREREGERAEEGGGWGDLLTINTWLKVGKHNALSGSPAAEPSRPSIRQLAIYPHSALGLVARWMEKEEAKKVCMHWCSVRT